MGRSYLIEYCVRYHKQKADELNFRVNLTETNRGLLCFLTGKWEEIPRYADTVIPQEEQKELTAEEVVDKIKSKIRQIGEQ